MKDPNDHFTEEIMITDPANIDPTTGEVLHLEKLPPFIRTPYNYDMNQASDATGLNCPEPTLAQQHFKEECDINTIVRRFGLTGELPNDVRVPLTGDFTEAVTDYQTALNMVKASDNAFLQLPAEVRARFANDPQQLLMFVEDPENRLETEKLGLVVPKAPPAPQTPPTPAAPAAPGTP